MATNSSQLDAALANLAIRQEEVHGLIGDASLAAVERPGDAGAQVELEALEQELLGYEKKERRLNAALAVARDRESAEGIAAARQQAVDHAKEAGKLMDQYRKVATRFDKAASDLANALGEMNALGRQIARSCWDAGLRHPQRLAFTNGAAGAVLAGRLAEGGAGDLLGPGIAVSGRAGELTLAEIADRNRARLERSLDNLLAEG